MKLGSADQKTVPLRDRCSFGRFPWLISQALSVTYMAGERRLYLERNCRLPESPAHSRRRNREGPASSKGLNSQRGFGPAVEPRRKSRPRSTSLHGSSPCKCQRLSTLRWDRLPPSRPSTKSGARAGGRRLSDRRLHRWLAGTSASAPSSHGAADLLGLNRAHICVRNPKDFELAIRHVASKLRGNTKNSHVFLTGRVSAWRPDIDLQFITEKLPSEESPREEAETDAMGLDHADGRVAIDGKAPKFYALGNLTDRQIAKYASAKGVSDYEALVAEIDRCDARSLAGRPQDLAARGRRGSS